MIHTMIAKVRACAARHANSVVYGSLVVAIAGYIALAWHKISYWSIWFDEAFSAYLTRFSYADVAKYTSNDVHPPLYYWALKAWTSLFGWNEASFRSLSIAFAVVAIVFAFLLAKRLFGKKVAVVASFCLAFSPMLIRYGQEARMYTMVTAIALAGTYAFAVAVQSKRKLPWVIYAILISMGMWTHYFSVLVWLAHWAWRAMVMWRKRNGREKHPWRAFWKRYFTKEWCYTYGLAVALYLPWLPFMLKQLTVVQANGFWIGAVGAYTFTDYLTEFFVYQDQSLVTSWIAVLFFAEVVVLIVMTVWCARHVQPQQKKALWLVFCCAIVPVMLLFAASLPPMTSSFVGRYLLPSQLCLSLLIAYSLVRYHGKYWRALRVAAAVGFIAMGIIGVKNVYYYGNYNKNSHTFIQTKFVVQEIQKRATPGAPIVTDSPWTFYEASFYNSDNHPIYFLDSSTHYEYGSLVMLRDNDWHKIKNVAAFAAQHEEIWYMSTSGGELKSPSALWKRTAESFVLTDPIDRQTLARAVRLTTN